MTKTKINLNINDKSLKTAKITNCLKNISIVNDELILLYKALQCNENYKENNAYTQKNGQFKYYANYDITTLIQFIKLNNIKSVLDLGCGAGILQRCLKLYDSTLNLGGYEIEDNLIKIYNKLNCTRAVKKDILTLTKKDIKDYEVLYFWEPLSNQELAEKFVNNLAEILNPNQIIVYKPSAYIKMYLDKNEKLVRVGNLNDLLIYTLK